MRVKKEITKFCDKLSIKASILVEFNMEKYNLNYKPHIYKSDIDFYEYPSKNAKKKPFPCNYWTDEKFSKMCDI